MQHRNHCLGRITEQTMKRSLVRLTLCALLALAGLGAAQGENWPQWRGPRADGSSLETGAPANWDPAKNLVWKVELPGSGYASPIVWGDRLFTVTALEKTQDRVLLCLDRKDGKLLWQKTVIKAPLEKKNNENGFASSTPATDGQRVYVSFLAGDEVVVGAYDFTGKQLWLVHPMRNFVNQHGYCTSPIVLGDKVIMKVDSKGDDFVFALNAADGKTAWQTARADGTQSFSPPLVIKAAGKTQLIVTGNKGVTSYDPANGKEIWKVDGPSEDFVAAPVYSEKAGLVFISSSWPKRELLAIKPDGTGNVTGSKIAWRTPEGAPYVPSPIAAGDTFLTASNSYEAFCYDAATGKILGKEKIGKHHSSPVLVNGLVYFLSDTGQLNVFKAGAKLERVQQAEFGEKMYASPAISEGQVFLRGDKHLFCLAAK